MSRTVSSTFSYLEFKAGGTGVAIGKTAETNDLLDIFMNTKITGNLELTGTLTSGIVPWARLSGVPSYVPTSRTVNGKALSANISLTAADVGAAESSHTHTVSTITTTTSGAANTIVQTDSAGDIAARLFRPTYANQTTISGAIAYRVNNSTDNYIRFCSDGAAIRSFIGAAESSHTHDYVPTSRTVNGKALSANISLTASDVSAVPTSRTVNSKALSANIALTDADIGTIYGSNANGAYLKMENGTLIMWHNLNFGYVSAHIYSVTWTFPHAVVAAGAGQVFGARSAANLGNTGANASTFTSDQVATSSVFLRMFDDNNSMVSGLTINVRVLFVGRWK